MKLKRHFPSYEMPSEMPLSTERASRVGGAIESFGKTMMAAGEKTHQVFMERQKTQDTLDGISTLNDARITLHKKLVELQKEPDENKIDSEFRKTFEEVKSKAMEKASGRKYLTQFLTKAFSDLDAYHTNSVRDMIFAKWNARAVGEYTKQVYNYSQMAIGSPDPAQQKQFIAEGEAFIKSMDGSILASDKVAEELIKFRASTAAGIAAADIQRDPKMALEKLKTRKYEHLDEVKRLQLIEAAEAQVKQVMREEREAHVNEVYLQIKDKYGMAGFERALTDLMDPQFLKANDITASEAHQLGIKLRAERADWDKMIADKQDETERKMYPDVYKKKISTSRVLSEVEQGNIRPEVGNHFITILTSEKKAVIDKAYYSEILQDILFERKGSREIYAKITEAIAAGRLDDAAADKLFLKLDAQEEKGLKFRQGRALKRIESVLLPKRGAWSPFTATPEEVDMVHKVQNEFLDWVNARKEAGSPLGSEEINKKVDQLIEDNKLDMYDRFENVTQKLKEEAEKFRKKKLEEMKTEKSGKKSVEKRRPGETLNQYLERTGQK